MVTPVEQFLPQLGRVLGVRREVPRKELREFYDKGDYQSIINTVKRGMGLDMNLVLGRARRDDQGPKGAAAWVRLPEKFMPPFGSREFRAMTIKIYIRHSYMNRAGFEEFVTVVAHELSHIVLDSIGHVWKRYEPAVDLAAMLMGYAEFYEDASRMRYHAYFASPFEKRWWRRFLSWYGDLCLPPVMCNRGYLSEEEIERAARWIRVNRR